MIQTLPGAHPPRACLFPPEHGGAPRALRRSLLRDPARLRLLHDAGLGGGTAEEAFGRATRLAARFLGAPMALVTLLDGKRQLLRGGVGLPEPWSTTRELPLGYGPGAQVVAGGAPRVVADVRTAADPGWGVEAWGVRAYAGFPLRAAGHALGSLCVLDTRPREWTDDERALLEELAAGLSAEMEVRLGEARRARTERALREREAYFRALVENTLDIILVVNGNGTVRFATPSTARLLGLAPEELTGRDPLDLVHPDDRERVERAFVSSEGGSILEYRVRHADGTWRTFEGIGRDLRRDPTVRGIVVNSRDVTERKRAEERLLHESLHDDLTGLPNRHLFRERLAHAFQRFQRPGEPLFAVLFLDLDRFKGVNDGLGHHAGDELLVAVAQRLRRCVRPGDTVARFGGDEFAVLLEDLGGAEDATRVAERIHGEIAAPVRLSGHEVHTSASIGIALASPLAETPEALLRNADLAMYRAKASKATRHETFG